VKFLKRLFCVTCLGAAFGVQAANVTKLNTITMVNGAADWSAAPAPTDVGEFGGLHWTTILSAR
jgi:hypothetical protein